MSSMKSDCVARSVRRVPAVAHVGVTAVRVLVDHDHELGILRDTQLICQ